MTFPLIATTAFGLEAIVSRELKTLGYVDQVVEDGRIHFPGDARAIARCNLWLRCADRLLLEVGRFAASDFGELFDRTVELPWEQWMSVSSAAFPVRGRSSRSQLHSVPDCQSIVKKAIVERLKRTHHQVWFDETGPSYAVEVSLLRDEATLAIDTSGPGLHKRGYRTFAGPAPLKERLAAALVLLSYWNRDRPLVDPLCGSGTIPIEAALIGRNLAPGMNRSFAAEAWPQLPPSLWDAARAEARDLALPPLSNRILATDQSAEAIRLARLHADAAGVAEDIHFQEKPLAEFSSSRKYGCVICNPPYGERLGDRREAETLYREMARVFAPLDTWSFYVLTAHEQFERLFGRTAERRRKLYNGRIACTYYQFAGPRPPRPRADSPAPANDAALESATPPPPTAPPAP